MNHHQFKTAVRSMSISQIAANHVADSTMTTAQIMTPPLGRFDLRKKHYHSAQRTTSLSYRRRAIESDRLGHDTLPDWYRRERNWSLSDRRLPRSALAGDGER